MNFERFSQILKEEGIPERVHLDFWLKRPPFLNEKNLDESKLRYAAKRVKVNFYPHSDV